MEAKDPKSVRLIAKEAQVLLRNNICTISPAHSIRQVSAPQSNHRTVSDLDNSVRHPGPYSNMIGLRSNWHLRV